MAPSARPVSLTVEQLLAAVDHLSPAQRREFQHRLAQRQAQDGGPQPDEEGLVRAARARLPAASERRLKRLAAKSERGRLTPKELAEYRDLAQRIDALRVEALAELARRRGQSVRAVRAALGGEGGAHDS